MKCASDCKIGFIGEGSDIAFTFRETQLVKGTLARGDKQHDVAAYFGVNGGRVAEVANGRCDYPTAQAAEPDKLPPPGPYVGAKGVVEIKGILSEAIDLILAAGSPSQESEVAVDALKAAIKRL